MSKTILTKFALEKQFDRYATAVLSAYLTAQPYERRKQRKYEVTKPLPTLDEYRDLRDKQYLTTVDDLVSDAFSEFEGLRDELQAWYDNLPESFQNGNKGDELQDAINGLENAQRPDVPEFFQKVSLVFLPDLKISSRSDRNAEGALKLQVVIDLIEEILSNGTVPTFNEESGEPDGGKRPITGDERDALEYLRDDIDSAKSEVEAVNFPGMY